MCIDFLAHSAAPILTRREAVVNGFGAAVWRVLLGFALPAACIFLALLYRPLEGWIYSNLGPWRLGHFGNDARFTVIPLVAGSFVWSVFLILSDADDKLRKLNWLCFGIFAATVFGRYSQSLFIVAAWSGHFAVHWAIHKALKARDAEETAGGEVPPVLDPQSRGEQDLLKKYGGVSGFDAPKAHEKGKSVSDN